VPDQKTQVRIRPGRAASILAMCMGILFVILGLTIGERFGPFGIIWTLAAAGITLYAAVNAFSSRGLASQVIDIDESLKPRPTTANRLNELDTLHKRGMITDAEYERKRTEILREL
jgi:hypothetical protein